MVGNTITKREGVMGDVDAVVANEEEGEEGEGCEGDHVVDSPRFFIVYLRVGVVVSGGHDMVVDELWIWNGEL